MSEKNEQSEKTQQFPGGYDSEGRSLYYPETFVSRSLQSSRLFVTRPLRFGSVNDLELVDVSSDLYPDIPSPDYALKEYIRTTFGEKEIPVYIFDDHNHALFAWNEALSEGKMEKGAKLVHFDDHLDGKRVGEKYKIPRDLKGLAQMAQSIDHDFFIDPAIRSGLVDTVYWVWGYSKDPKFDPGDKYEIANITLGSSHVGSVLEQELNSKLVIVDIDLDYFTYTKHEVEFELELKRMKEAMNKAGVITMAISPGFINEQRALELIKRLVA